MEKPYTSIRAERYQPGGGPVKGRLLVFELGREVGHATVQAGQLGVVGFRHFNLVALSQLHNDVQEIHGVQFELVTERHVAFEMAEVLIWRDHADDLDDGLLDLVVCHVETSPEVQPVAIGPRKYTIYILFTTTTELIPSMPEELLRI